MAASHSHLAYDDLRYALDRALSSEKGIKIYEASLGKLIHLRHRLHKLRSMERKRSEKVYPPEDPRHGTSPYDKLFFQTSRKALDAKGIEAELLTRDDLYIEIIPRTADAIDLEEIA